MGDSMSRAKIVVASAARFYGVRINCPADHPHVLCVDWTPTGMERADTGARPVWQFNGDLNRPTFSPSIADKRADGYLCHSFVRNGRIQFLHDCTHALAGQTVDLPEISETA